MRHVLIKNGVCIVNARANIESHGTIIILYAFHSLGIVKVVACVNMNEISFLNAFVDIYSQFIFSSK